MREVAVRVETGRDGLAESGHERLAVAAAADVLADVVGFRPVEHDEIAPAGRLQRLAGRGLRFLVLDLAVDHGREAFTGIAGDVLPHVQDRPAGRVDQRAAEALETRQFVHGHAEGRDDHHVALAQPGRRLAGIAQEPDAGGPQLLVDVGVVDDLAGQEHPLVDEPLPGLVGVVDRAIDAVTEAELPRQVDGQPAARRTGNRWSGCCSTTSLW